MICIFNSEQFIYGTFEDCIGLFNSLYRSFLCQNLYLVKPLLLWQFSNCVWAPFHHKLAQHNFWDFILNFDACCDIFMSPPMSRMIADAFYIISNAWENNKWLSVKYALIALLIISLVSINTKCSSSKWSKKNKWLQKIKGKGARPLHPL